MRYPIAVLLCLFVLGGCAGLQPQTEITDDVFISERPSLKVQIDATVYKRGKNGQTWWWGCDGAGVAVNIYRDRTREEKLDYYYSLEHIVKNQNGVALGSVHFNDHKWLRYAYANKQGYLHTGYYTRKGRYFISVYRFVEIGGSDLAEVEKWRRDHELTTKQRALFEEAFEHTDRMFIIVY